MRFIKRIRSKLLPVSPYFFQYFRIVPILPTTFNELWFHVVQLITQFLTHRLTQSIRLSTGKIGQQTGQEHYLFLIYSNTVCIFQIFLHYGNIILDRFASVFTIDEIGNVIHRSRTIKGIHGNQVFKSRRLQLPQVFLHAGRLKLERTDRTPVTIELVSSRVFNGNRIDIQLFSFTQPNIFNRFLNDGQSFQSQKVHLNQSRIFNNRSLILGNKHLFACFLIIGRTYRHPVGYIIPADNGTTGMYTCTTHITFEHQSIFQCITHQRIRRRLSRLQLRHIIDGIPQIQLFIRYFIRHQFRQSVRFRKRQFLYTRHIFDSQFRCHRTICNNMSHLLMTIFFCYPTKHFTASVIIKVNIDIRQ